MTLARDREVGAEIVGGGWSTGWRGHRAPRDLLDTITTATDELAALAGQIDEHAKARHIRVVTATVDLDGVVALDETALDVEAVVELASSLGTQLMYLSSTQVDATTLITVSNDHTHSVEPDEGTVALQAALRSLDGFTRGVEVAFAYGGVIHTWTKRSTWVEVLDAIQGCQRAARRGEDDICLLPFSSSEVSEETVAVCVDQLAADPAFRRARTVSERNAAAGAFPAIAELTAAEHPWDYRRIVQAAQQRVGELADHAADELLPRIAGLAAEFATTEQFRAARLVEARRRTAHEWIATTHTNSLRLPSWWIKELVAAANTSHRASGQLGLH